MLTQEAINLINDVFKTPNLKIIVSNPLKKNCVYFKITIEPKAFRDDVVFQFSLYYEEKVKHINLGKHESAQKLIELLSAGYKQCDIYTEDKNHKILSGKSSSKIITSAALERTPGINVHNREKNYLIPENEPVDWLISLGIMDVSGRVYSHAQKKFRQINRFIEMITDVDKYIENGTDIIDFGCGKSYLTFAMYYYFNILKNKNITITGLDLKHDVVDYCNGLAQDFGFGGLKFLRGDIADYLHNNQKISMVVSLHACDTATDYAIYNAIKWNACVILAVPCCQHELFGQIKNTRFNVLLGRGILKERFSALLTDALRAEALESCGYKTTVMEFIDMEHTPKNIMIKAIKKNTGMNIENFIDAETIMREFNVRPKLYELLKK